MFPPHFGLFLHLLHRIYSSFCNLESTAGSGSRSCLSWDADTGYKPPSRSGFAGDGMMEHASGSTSGTQTGGGLRFPQPNRLHGGNSRTGKCCRCNVHITHTRHPPRFDTDTSIRVLPLCALPMAPERGSHGSTGPSAAALLGCFRRSQCCLLVDKSRYCSVRSRGSVPLCLLPVPALPCSGIPEDNAAALVAASRGGNAAAAPHA